MSLRHFALNIASVDCRGLGSSTTVLCERALAPAMTVATSVPMKTLPGQPYDMHCAGQCSRLTRATHS